MLGLDTLDVGIGMALMFLFVSLIASAIREAIETVMKARSQNLARGIGELLGDRSIADMPYIAKSAVNWAASKMGANKAAAARTAAVVGPAKPPGLGIVQRFYEHPQINALYAGRYDATRPRGLPSYIPAANFARAVLDLAVRGDQVAPDAPATIWAIRANIAKLENTQLQRAVLNALDRAKNDLDLAQKHLEEWFDSAMERVSGWYKRHTQVWLFVIGLACAVLMNIDAITVMQTLSTDKTLRAEVVKAAAVELAKPAPGQPATASDIRGTVDKVKDATAEMGSVNWPIGWASFGAKQDRPVSALDWWAGVHPAPQYRAARPGGLFDVYLSAALGWLITAVGVTFGAAFWFDVLNKFMIVRSTIKPDEKSPKEKSKS